MAKTRKSAAEQIVVLRNRADKLEREERQRQADRDTRRKLVLASCLLARAEAYTGHARTEILSIIGGLQRRDRQKFADWQPNNWTIPPPSEPSSEGDASGC